MDTTVVSCYYQVRPKFGRDEEKYMDWFKRLQKVLCARMVIFTDAKAHEVLEKHITSRYVECVFVEFDDLHFSKLGETFWLDQQEKDPNKDRCWQLSVLYNEKCEFVRRAMELYDSEWFTWTDIGCFRDDYVAPFPKIDHVPRDKMTLLVIDPFKKKEKKGHIFHTEKQARIGGTFQVAQRHVWNAWIPKYHAMFDVYVEKSTVNCDQGPMASIVLEHPDMVNLVQSKKTKITKDRWFYLIEYLSCS
jgi:hypothetical protein